MNKKISALQDFLQRKLSAVVTYKPVQSCYCFFINTKQIHHILYIEKEIMENEPVDNILDSLENHQIPDIFNTALQSKSFYLSNSGLQLLEADHLDASHCHPLPEKRRVSRVTSRVTSRGDGLRDGETPTTN